eukprot:SAG31_NODE_618_length_13513_cov_87.043164_8_plen_72_part_00
MIILFADCAGEGNMFGYCDQHFPDLVKHAATVRSQYHQILLRGVFIAHPCAGKIVWDSQRVAVARRCTGGT